MRRAELGGCNFISEVFVANDTDPDSKFRRNRMAALACGRSPCAQAAILTQY
jgi:hypothetical protein